MSKRRMASLVSVLLAMFLVLSACSTTDTSKTSGSGEPKKANQTKENAPSNKKSSSGDILNELGMEPIVKEPYTLTIGLPQNTNVEDYDTNHYTQLLEKKSGMDIKFEMLPAKDAKQKLAVMVSGGSALPDIISMALSDSEVYSYGSQGYFIPLNDYYENNSFYFQQIVEENGLDTMLNDIISADGNIYTVPLYNPEYGNEWDHRAWINKTWLKALDLDMPETTEDFYQVLKAFKEKDPNGNNKADEIPYMGHINGWNSQPQDFFMNAFIYYNTSYNYILADNGKIDIAANKDEWKQGLQYLNKLYKEGLISPLTFTQDRPQFQQAIENPDAQIIGSITTGSMSIYQTDSKRKEDMTALPPLTGPNGVCWSTKRYQGPSSRGYVTKDAKNPEIAFRLLDLMCDKELSINSRFGEKDKDWKFATDADKGTGLYENMDIPATIKVINNHWGQPQNAEWAEDTQPAIRPYQYGIGGMTWDGNEYDSQYMTAQAVPSYIDKAPEEVVLKVPFTTEENDRTSEILTSLKTYIDESTQRFIVGDMPFSEWDNYVSELDNIGLEEYLKVVQKAYDRYRKNK